MTPSTVISLNSNADSCMGSMATDYTLNHLLCLYCLHNMYSIE